MLDTKNILDLILNSSQHNEVCFLCFKSRSNILQNIYSELDIFGDCFNLKISLAEIMKQLFPSHDILFGQACKECTDLLLKMFFKLYKYKNNIEILNCIIKNIDRQVQDINPKNMNKIFIRMNKPEHKVIEDKVKPSKKNPKNTYICITCDVNFITNDLLQEHKNSIHKKSEATICDVCGQTLKSPTSLKAHINCHKEKECPYCFKTLKCHSHYNVHIKSHKSNVKRKRNKNYYSCNNCNYQSLNKKTLEAHINKIHLHIRPYVCETCDKGFYKKSHLTEHVKIHSQIKNKTCEVCGEHFGNDKTLIEHQRLHSNEKPYECNICRKKFVTSGRRSDHIKRSHMEKTESCIFCDKKYSLKKELNRHIKKSHTEISLNIENNFDINISNYKFDETMLPIS